MAGEGPTPSSVTSARRTRHEWTGMFPAGGTSGLFGRSGNCLVYGELAIAAPDGRSRSVRLDELVKDSRRSLRDDDPIELSVPLAAPSASHSPASQRTGAATRPA